MDLASSQPAERERVLFRRRHRLGTGAQFEAVFNGKLKKSRGAITVFLLATDEPEHRLGLSVGRRLGNAVVRGRFKRMIRLAFQHSRADLPVPGDRGSYDIVVTVRRHDALSIEEYTELFVGAVEAGHRVHLKRADDDG